MPESLFHDALPNSSQAVYDRLYQGDIFLLSATDASLILVDEVSQRIASQLECAAGDICHASPERLFERLAPVRAWLRDDREHLAPKLRNVLNAYGFEADKGILDYPRLRIVSPQLSSRVTAQHDVHRDCWYANPRQQINLWLPLHAMPPEQSFAFYPEYFNRAVANSSNGFDYQRWVKEVGWQAGRSVSPDRYPQMQEAVEDRCAQHFSAEKAACLFFSAQHLHGTKPNRTATTRDSIDVRFVPLGQTGAVTCDSYCTGDSSVDYDYLPSIGQEAAA